MPVIPLLRKPWTITTKDSDFSTELQDWKIQVVCMEDSIGCKIGNFQTESNVIMLHKHSNKSVSESLFIFHQRIQNLSANIV